MPAIYSKALKEPALSAAEGPKENPPQADKKHEQLPIKNEREESFISVVYFTPPEADYILHCFEVAQDGLQPMLSDFNIIVCFDCPRLQQSVHRQDFDREVTTAYPPGTPDDAR